MFLQRMSRKLSKCTLEGYIALNLHMHQISTMMDVSHEFAGKFVTWLKKNSVKGNGFRQVKGFN